MATAEETPRVTALVTGASSGIGQAIAEILAQRGYDLIITARRRDRLETLAASLRAAHDVRVDVIDLDLAAPGAGETLYQSVQALGANVGVLINNAGFGAYGTSLELPPERVAEMVQLNVVALTELTHRFGRDMLAAGSGRILQVASVAAFQPSPLYAVYAATKAYVLHMSVAMHKELAGRGVTLTTVCPGLTDTEFHEVADHLKPKSLDWTQMSAREVATSAVDAMLAGREVITPGAVNKLAGAGVKLIPRGWSAAIAGAMMKARREE